MNEQEDWEERDGDWLEKFCCPEELSSGFFGATLADVIKFLDAQKTLVDMPKDFKISAIASIKYLADSDTDYTEAVCLDMNGKVCLLQKDGANVLLYY